MQLVDVADNPAEQAVLLSSLGLAALHLNRYKAALFHLQHGLSIAKELRDIRAQGYILNALGQVYHKMADQGMAKDCYQQAIQLRQIIQDRRGEGWSLYYLGQVAFELSSSDEAYYYQDQALLMAKETGDEELQICTQDRPIIDLFG